MATNADASRDDSFGCLLTIPRQQSDGQTAKSTLPFSHNQQLCSNKEHICYSLSINMKIAAALALLATSASAFAPSAQQSSSSRLAAAKESSAFTVDTIPGAVAPTGIFDPLGFAAKADEATLKRYREAELTHGRVAMLATVGFLVGEAVEGSTYLFNGEITGPAITHIPQVNPVFWILLGAGIAKAETKRAEIGWLEPRNVKYDKPGLLRDSYVPGNLGFDPLGLKPSDPVAFAQMQTKELQNGRLAMLAAAGFMAQEMVNGKGIIETLLN